MREAAFEAYMQSRELAERTRMQRSYALKRMERVHGVDLDVEFERDGLQDLIGLFSYSAADARSGRANPTRMDIEPDKLLTHLRWYRTHLVDYARFRTGAEPALPSPSEETALTDELVEEVVGKTFALERDLQAALRRAIAQLEPGLVVEDGGAERRVEGGFIDILARDGNGLLTIIELKAETARPESVAQILAYMGCIAEETGEAVRGILVAGDHHPRVQLAAKAVPNLSLKKYSYRFEFE